jgi:hypothetical protein
MRCRTPLLDLFAFVRPEGLHCFLMVGMAPCYLALLEPSSRLNGIDPALGL